MYSIWKNESARPGFGTLEGDIKTDVLIIGGGMAGILCAYMLKKEGTDCVICEADRICEGVTEGTTAKITVQHGLIYQKLLKSFGAEKAKLYFAAQSEAAKQYRMLCKEIPCDYETKDSYIYSTVTKKSIEDELYAYGRIGINGSFSLAEELPFKVCASARISDQAQFNPLKFAFGIAKGLTVYEDARITGINGKTATTRKGNISFEKAIVTTHFPIFNGKGGYFLKMYQHRSYVLGLEGAKGLCGMYADAENKGLSFRSYGENLLLGGGGHRTGKQGGSFSELEEVCEKYYPDCKIAYRWGTQDCMTLDGIPYIGKYSKSTPHIYVATGFNKWGMTSAMAAAIMLSKEISGKECEYLPLFSPSRSIMHPQLAVNIWEAALGYLSPTLPRCPHMGCALRYNPQEHSWDCPCHGSRFSAGGKLQNGPATKNKKIL